MYRRSPFTWRAFGRRLLVAATLVAAVSVLAAVALARLDPATEAVAAPLSEHAHHGGMPMPPTAPPVTPVSRLRRRVTPTRVAGEREHAMHREFAANCTVTQRRDDDPIVFPGQPGASHNHTFIGNRRVTASTKNAALIGGRTSCEDPADGTAYWFPTLFEGARVVRPEKVTVYYKSGVDDQRTVLPFPPGFRLLIGDMRTPSVEEFGGRWSCGGSGPRLEWPASCPEGSMLIVRYQAPSCWDGVTLDPSDHRSHMVDPVDGSCTRRHPVALPMLEVKIPYKLPSLSTADLRYASGRSFSFHADFMNGWRQARQRELVEHCINGGRQCNGVGYDQHKP
jgi:hypothetical protein